MPKILKRGRLPEEITYDLTCSKCATFARYTQIEVTYGGSKYNMSYYSFVCPLCEHVNTIDGTDLDENETRSQKPVVLPVQPENLRTFDK